MDHINDHDITEKDDTFRRRIVADYKPPPPELDDQAQQDPGRELDERAANRALIPVNVNDAGGNIVGPEPRYRYRAGEYGPSPLSLMISDHVRQTAAEAVEEILRLNGMTVLEDLTPTREPTSYPIDLIRKAAHEPSGYALMPFGINVNDPSYRWNGEYWERKGEHAQAGHFPVWDFYTPAEK